MSVDRVTHRDLAWESSADGVRVTGTEIFETRRDLTFAAGVSDDRKAVILSVGGAEYAMPAEAARILAAALTACARTVEATSPDQEDQERAAMYRRPVGRVESPTAASSRQGRGRTDEV